MIRPATLNLAVQRWTPFDHSIAITGLDLTGASLRAQVRLLPDTAGTALIDLEDATPAAEGLSVSVDTSGDDPVSTIRIIIDEATLAAMPDAAELGDNAVFYWDLTAERVGYVENVLFRGTFTVEAGVTQ